MSRERIVDAAVELVEANGVDELSMRKLAAELGVAPTTIYWHVGDRDAVLDAVVERLVSESRDISPRGDSPAARITSIARQIRRQVLVHPALMQLAIQRGRGPAVSFPAQVAVASEVEAAGLRGAAAARAVWSILYFVGGHILLEGMLPEMQREGRSTDDLWAHATATERVAARLAREMAHRPPPEEVFEHSLAALLRGLLPGR
jgi:AcrR family transcriptional regulator